MKYKITFTGNNKYFGEQKIEKIIEKESLLYPTELLSHIMCDIGICENICDNFTIECEEIEDTDNTDDTADIEYRQKWGVLA